MALKEYKPEKLLYTMGEVTEMFDVKPSLIRFWEQRFDILKPKKNKKGNRLFTPADVKNLEIIYHLTKDRGMTLSGVEKYLKNNKDQAERDTEIVRRLQTMRALLAEIREELRDTPEGEIEVFVAGQMPEAEEQPETTGEPSTVEEIPDFWAEEPQVIPGEIDEEEEAEEIGKITFEGFSDEVDPFSLRDVADKLTDHDAASGELAPTVEEETLSAPEIFMADEEVVDEEVTEPFTIQPLFELGDTPETQPEENPSASQPEEEIKTTAFDTQQSLF